MSSNGEIDTLLPKASNVPGADPHDIKRMTIRLIMGSNGEMYRLLPNASNVPGADPRDTKRSTTSPAMSSNWELDRPEKASQWVKIWC